MLNMQDGISVRDENEKVEWHVVPYFDINSCDGQPLNGYLNRKQFNQKYVLGGVIIYIV